MSHRTITAPPDPTAPLLRTCLVLGGVTGAAGVMLLATAAHIDPAGLLRTAAEMLLFHAPVFLALGAIAQIRRSVFLPVALLLLFFGLALFCGDLLSRSFADRRLFPMSAPTGGMLIIVGWAAIALMALRIRAR